jgi:hypothetical protein
VAEVEAGLGICIVFGTVGVAELAAAVETVIFQAEMGEMEAVAALIQEAAAGDMEVMPACWIFPALEAAVGMVVRVEEPVN